MILSQSGVASPLQTDRRQRPDVGEKTGSMKQDRGSSSGRGRHDGAAAHVRWQQREGELWHGNCRGGTAGQTVLAGLSFRASTRGESSR